MSDSGSDRSCAPLFGAGRVSSRLDSDATCSWPAARGRSALAPSRRPATTRHRPRPARLVVDRTAAADRARDQPAHDARRRRSAISPGRPLPAARRGSPIAPAVGRALRAPARSSSSSRTPLRPRAAHASRPRRVADRGDDCPSRLREFRRGAIDPAEDAEAVARALTARPDVEYAQAAYRVPPASFVPNDRFYTDCSGTCRRSTWSAPGTSSRRPDRPITVAVLDTGDRLHERHDSLPRRAPSWIDERRPRIRRSAISRLSFVDGDRARARRRASSRRTISSGTTTRRSISTATARTSAAPSAS